MISIASWAHRLHNGCRGMWLKRLNGLAPGEQHSALSEHLQHRKHSYHRSAMIGWALTHHLYMYVHVLIFLASFLCVHTCLCLCGRQHWFNTCNTCVCAGFFSWNAAAWMDLAVNIVPSPLETRCGALFDRDTLQERRATDPSEVVKESANNSESL